MTTLAERVLVAHHRLIAAGLHRNEAELDAEVLARHALGWNRTTFLMRRPEPPPPTFDVCYDLLVERRCQREPVAQIIGVREFWGLEIEVSRDVLVPRPETELLVETTLNFLKDRTGPWRIADVGTGSACLAIALALEFPKAQIAATDISQTALAVAQRNVATYGLTTRVSCHLTNFLDGLSGPFDLIVSNPPYVPDQDIETLAPEIRFFEPLTALAGGPDGLDPARTIAAGAVSRLHPEGWLVMEIGAGQSPSINAIALQAGIQLVSVYPDIQGTPRAAVMRHAQQR